MPVYLKTNSPESDRLEYEEFISFIEEGNSNFQTKSEKKFEQAFELSEKEALSNGIKNSYEDLVGQLQKQKIEELSKNKESIKELLSDEIINRYYFKKGEYQNHIAYSLFIKEAISVLENDEQYRSILLNGKN